MEKRKLIIDCDPGHDDAIALVLALACDQFDIRAITTVGGNQTVEKVTRNTLQILELCKRTDIPVAMGRTGPYFENLVLGEKFHGKSGMDGNSLPQPVTKPVDMLAVELIANVLEESDEPVTLLVTGPFSNIATFLLAYPHLHHKIDCLSLMGGSYYRGNWSPIAEFNVWIDPEAAEVLMRSGIPFYLHGLDVTHQAYIRRDEYAELRRINNPVSNFIADLLDFYSKSCIDERNHPGCLMHDATASGCLIDPTLFSYLDSFVHMDIDGKLSRGGCLIDVRPEAWRTGEIPNNGKVATWVDRERFVDLVISSCRSLGDSL